jgi:glutamate--cysteine ligase
MVLFGASPVVSASFLRGRTHQLQRLSEDTLYLPYATSLRMSDLGYQNNAQAGLVPPYNDLASYMKNLSQAVKQPWPAYVALGTKREGEWIQINTNVLQIENEFYSTIRPKRVINSGERPVEALCARGVQYIEVRCLDIDPFEPTGINLETARFMDAFLLSCALDQSPLTSEAEGRENTANFGKAVMEGRTPGLQLQRDGQSIELKAWGLELLDRIEAAARLLDIDRVQPDHQNALARQRAKLNDFTLTPSARVLEALRQHGNSFVDFSLAQSQQHAAWFRSRPLSAAETEEFAQMARASLDEQARMEREQTGDFDQFIEAYRVRALIPTCCD